MTQSRSASSTIGAASPRSMEQCLGQLLRLVRLGRGLTLETAAQRCGGFSPSQLGRWELAARPLPMEVLDAIARSYGVRTARLIEEASFAAGSPAEGIDRD